MNVVLFGFMGVGKTTIGRLLVPRLGYRFVDSDTETEKTLGMKISEAFTHLGEPAFRTTECDVIRRLSASDEQIIALGGGAILDPTNVDSLRRTGRMVLLTASPEEIVLRTRGDSSRPLLAGGEKLARIRGLLDERRERYLAAADIVINTNGVPTIQVAEAIISRLGVAAR